MRTTPQVFFSLLVAAFFGTVGCQAFTAQPPLQHSAKPSMAAAAAVRKSSTTQLYISSPLEAWQAYNSALESDPLLVKSITASGIFGAADLTGQAIERAKKQNDAELDVLRTLRFALFGLILQAPWNHYFYLYLDGALPPTAEPWTPTTGIKVVIDQFVQAPIFTVLIFVFLGALEGKQLDDIQKQLEEDYKDTMLDNWKLFIPATIVNLAFVPPLFRVLYLNVVFFFWSIYLSLKINKGDGEDLTQ
jgi:peroxisomal membrane protein 2